MSRSKFLQHGQTVNNHGSCHMTLEKAGLQSRSVNWALQVNLTKPFSPKIGAFSCCTVLGRLVTNSLRHCCGLTKKGTCMPSL
ncbi:hypothetical protein CBR_g49797 [Chara braunii]|uniref:Uncharacterized protein n=1 Tax=Chara braunii TaxID=69332 RepID=A0A388JP33_CHABU|nr:hypothetical protein CBR_g49797 [Chara braunii]|eukprot:GBG59537.1 hypothetical protein CBR_g49797 [Chara braunii]